MDKRQLVGSTPQTDTSAKLALGAGEWPIDFPAFVCYVRQLRPGETHLEVPADSKDYLAFNKDGEFIRGHDHAGQLFMYLYQIGMFPVTVH